jgi:mRNA interferase MazF
MKQAGQIVLFRFPQTDLEEGKLRPALLLGRLPGEHDEKILLGAIGQIASERPQRIKGRLAEWLTNS